MRCCVFDASRGDASSREATEVKDHGAFVSLVASGMPVKGTAPFVSRRLKVRVRKFVLFAKSGLRSLSVVVVIAR